MVRRFIYLHGFASGPKSYKAQYLAQRFQKAGLDLEIPDLNQDDFYGLTLTRQIQQVTQQINEGLLPQRGSTNTPSSVPVTLIGSSLGGVVSAWVAETCAAVEQLIVLAPAFHFLEHWRSQLGAETLETWQIRGEMAIYHYGERRSRLLSYQFIRDLEQYDDSILQRAVPTVILHGIWDEVIPIESSRQFCQSHPWVQLIELNSDHALGDVGEEIWCAIQDTQHLRTSCENPRG